MKLVSGFKKKCEIVQFQDFFKVQTLAGHDIVYQQVSSYYLLLSLQSIDEWQSKSKSIEDLRNFTLSYFPLNASFTLGKKIET